jgi:hypothetical protein
MRAWVGFLFLAFSVAPALAAEEFVASLRLRGGYDSNPLLTPGGKGAAFTTLDAAFAGGRKNDSGWISGVTGEFSVTKFSEPEFTAFQNHRFRLRLSNENVEDFSVDSTATFAAAKTYDTRISLASQRAHIQYVKGKLQPFVTGDIRAVALNELSPLLGDFLPEPLHFLRGTITPGIAYVEGKNEAGVSLTAGHSKYEGNADYFGFRRDHTRVQPAAYAKFENERLLLRGSISYFRAYSEDIFFTDVSHFLFDIGGTTNWEGWSAEVSLAQTAEETSFPVSPMTINRLFQARLSRSFDDRIILGVFMRDLRREYWDTPLHSRTRLVGFDVNHIIGPEIALAGEVAFARSLLLSGDEADGVVATLSLTKRFNAAQKK